MFHTKIAMKSCHSLGEFPKFVAWPTPCPQELDGKTMDGRRVRVEFTRDSRWDSGSRSGRGKVGFNFQHGTIVGTAFPKSQQG